MATRMLIDAAHPEETRVVIVRGTRLEEFDIETASRKQLRGNIYLAKVTRVEPSLQAAFVDYGGNRHGFLAFSDIHPDYYQIPIADRQALLRQHAALETAAADDLGDRRDTRGDDEPAPSDDDGSTGEEPRGEDDNPPFIDAAGSDTEAAPIASASADQDEGDAPEFDEGDDGEDDDEEDRDLSPAEDVESLGGEDDDLPDQSTSEGAGVDEMRRQLLRRYKIQEVIKRRQILLVQVVKEERGNKGAALTTYLSLAGRYCVLMPNSTRGGGISRKITNATDRKRLKTITDSLGIPEGMRLIVRTAGLNRTKVEVRRDYEYLLRLWDNIRELTLNSTAPALIYEDANIIKRSIRDLYAKEMDEVLVEGDDGYKSAKSFMRMFMPSHAKRVQPYTDRIPLLHRYRIEEQFASMHEPTVQLKSGGYIVINQTEALVAIDVNSGRATRERNIEETAYKTNLEAAEEISRQLRLRDLAGLIVIDFIDMQENRNIRKVERCLKDCLKTDRARIQVGRISSFGLLEMSRQRLRPSLIETSSEPCPRCGGTGVVRSIESSALHILHVIEEEGVRGRSSEVTVHVATPIALYLLNQKRQTIIALEQRFGFRIGIEADDSLLPPSHRLERVGGRPAEAKPLEKPAEAVPVVDETEPEIDDVEDDLEETDAERQEPARADDGSPREDSTRKRRRRGRRGGRRRRRRDEDAGTSETMAESEQDEVEAAAEQALETTPSSANSMETDRELPLGTGEPADTDDESAHPADTVMDGGAEPDVAGPDTPQQAWEQTDTFTPVNPTTEREEVTGLPADLEVAADVEPVAPVAVEAIEPALLSATADEDQVAAGASRDEPENKPKRRGWWQRSSA
jgi:ribonuclease E